MRSSWKLGEMRPVLRKDHESNLGTLHDRPNLLVNTMHGLYVFALLRSC